MSANPFKGPDGEFTRTIQLLLRTYKIEDPPTNRQQPLSPSGLRHIIHHAVNTRDKFVENLLAGAFFFACRSCEYVKTAGTPRTQILLASDIRFFRITEGSVRQVEVTATDMDAVQIRFRIQKNLSAEDMITQQKSGDKLCPVAAWAFVCRHLKSEHGTLNGIAVNEYGGHGGPITYKDIDKVIRAAYDILLSDRDSLSGADFGTHSVRCGAALAMYLSGTPVVDIMLQGRWSSDAFLVYIKRQVMELSVGVSSKMVEMDDFTVLPRRPNTAPLHRSNKSLTYRSSLHRDLTTSPRLHLSH